MSFPIFGGVVYLLLGNRKIPKALMIKDRQAYSDYKKYALQNIEILSDLHEDDYVLDKMTSMAWTNGYFPVYDNCLLTYFPSGEEQYKAFIQELIKAEDFIFMEFFIINKGVMWNTILQILMDKAAMGVDVRVIYDDMGCIALLPTSYPKQMEEKGIKCIAFNKLNPFLGVIMNNRDHRKMMIIDGKTVFSGGMNLADEYINLEHPYGKWKDNGIKITGEAVWNFTIMFLNMWNSYRKDDEDYKKYKYDFSKENLELNGYTIPYGETPLDNEIVGENVYLNIINQAQKYVYIMTPYLIIDTDMINSLILAAKRGVDVRIVVPGIPDKKIVYSLTTSYFETLIKNGVKIYKYMPGFVHSKVFVSDDNIATVGTINLDYRSLYLHFECGVFMQDVEEIKDVKKDLVDTIGESHFVSKKEAMPKLLKSVWQAVLRLFAPLM